LLQENNATAAEVAYKVGFGSPAYFNKCFSAYFGFPPGEVKKKWRKAPCLPEENPNRRVSLPERNICLQADLKNLTGLLPLPDWC
jgi:AraC-like DNA-binding protein